MAIKGFEKQDSMAGLNQLMQLMSQVDAMGARKEQRMANKMTALNNQIKNANSLDSLENITSVVNKFNQETTLAGYDQYSLDSILTNKKELFNNANNSFNLAIKYQDENIGLEDDPDNDALYNKIMGYSLSEATKEIDELYKIKEGMAIGVESGYKFSSYDKYSMTSLDKAITKRIGQIENKLDVFAENEGKFLVYDAASGEMDGEAREMYDDLQFKILSGDTKDFDKYFDDVIGDISRKFQIQEKGYNDWLEVYEESRRFDKTVSEIAGDDAKAISALLNEGLSRDSIVTPEVAKRIMENYQINAKKYNEQHKILTGKEYNTNPIYMDLTAEDPLFTGKLPGTTTSDTSSSVVEEKKVDKEKIKENVEKSKKKDSSIILDDDIKEERKRLGLDGGDLGIKGAPKVEEVAKSESQLNYEFILDEGSKKNITQAWAKNPEMYNESAKMYIDDVLVNTDDITKILDFGKEMGKAGINLNKKGAFPGLKKEVDKIKPKILSFLQEARDSYNKDKSDVSKKYLIGISKDIINSFSWDSELIELPKEILKSLDRTDKQ